MPRFAGDKRERRRKENRKEEEEGKKQRVRTGGDLFWKRHGAPFDPSRGDPPREVPAKESLLQVWPLIRQNCGKYETNHTRA